MVTRRRVWSGLVAAWGGASCGLWTSITGAAPLAEDEGRILVGDLEHVDFRHFSCLPCTRRHGAVRGGRRGGWAAPWPRTCGADEALGRGAKKWATLTLACSKVSTGFKGM